jgi:hypothetical protein
VLSLPENVVATLRRRARCETFLAGPSKTLIPFGAPYPDAKTWQFSEGGQGAEMGAGLAAVGSQRGSPWNAPCSGPSGGRTNALIF